MHRGGSCAAAAAAAFLLRSHRQETSVSSLRPYRRELEARSQGCGELYRRTAMRPEKTFFARCAQKGPPWHDTQRAQAVADAFVVVGARLVLRAHLPRCFPRPLPPIPLVFAGKKWRDSGEIRHDRCTCANARGAQSMDRYIDIRVKKADRMSEIQTHGKVL